MADPSLPTRRALLVGSAAGVASSMATRAAALAPPASLDAELLGLCADWLANDAEYNRMFELECAMEEKAAAAGVKLRWQERIDFSGVVADGHDLLEAITATPARTAAGRHAKAAVLAARVAPGGEDPAPPNHDECLALSLARDVLALAGRAS